MGRLRSSIDGSGGYRLSGTAGEHAISIEGSGETDAAALQTAALLTALSQLACELLRSLAGALADLLNRPAGSLADVLDGLGKNGPENNAAVEREVNGRVRELCARFPIYS